MWTKIKPWLFVPGFIAILAAIVRYTLIFSWDAAANALVAAGLLLIITTIVLNWQDSKKLYRKRSTVYLTFSLVSTAIMLGILFLINFIVFLHPQKLDLTQSKFFTLSEQTVKVLGGLNRTVDVLAFYKDSEHDGQLEYLARQYHEYNRRFNFRFVNPDSDPTFAQKYGVSKYKTVIMESGDKRLRVDEANESGLTSTLIKLTQEHPKTVYFLTGHAEHNYDSIDRDGYSHAKKALEETNYEVKLLNLAEAKKVPDDCAALIVPGARQDPGAAELESLDQYLNAGGGVLLLLDPTPGIGFEPLLARYGVKVGNDVVVDASGSGRAIGAGPEVPLIRNYTKTDITTKFFLPTFYPRSRSLSPTAEAPPGVKVVPLMQTSRSSWGETELGGGGGGARYDEGKDLAGPVTLAVEISRTLAPASATADSKPSTARLVAFGDSDFATNVYFNAQGNGDLFVNSVSWLAGQTDVIAIRPKKPENKRLTLSAQSNTVVFYICVLLMPAVPLSAGVWVLMKRYR